MKKILLLMAAALLLGCSGQPDQKEAAEEADTEAAAAEWVEVTLDVEGMTCEGCENAIKAGVETLPGIAEIESSHEEAFTRVKFDRTVTSLEEITGKITETGYQVKGERSPADS